MMFARRLSFLMLGFALIAPLVTSEAGAQQTSTSQQAASPQVPPAPATPVSNSIISLKKKREWTLHAEIFLRSFAFRTTQGRHRPHFELERAAVVYPLIEGSGSHKVHLEKVAGRVTFENRLQDDSFELLDGYHSGERMARWDVENVRGSNLRLIVDIPMTTYETRFDEQRAMEIGWPTQPLPPVAASCLTPQQFIESDDPGIPRRIDDWTNGRARSIPPARLAKFIAGKVVDEFQPNGEGYVFGRNGKMQGFDLQGAARSNRTMRGSPFDMVALTCALYRAAGIPARVVLGYDVLRSLGEDSGIFFEAGDCFAEEIDQGVPPFPIFHAWVEFYLRDENTGEQAWIPVDVLKQRKVSSRAPDLDRPWRYFGRNDCLENVLPISFHFHPPTTVVAPGAPALWGWLPEPEVTATEQNMLYRAMHTPKRAGD